jgi:aryl-alcohol dehydrogenase-like predicted oxidoreductase
MDFGWRTSAEGSHEIMDRAHTEGVDFADTAHVYGFARVSGQAVTRS